MIEEINTWRLKIPLSEPYHLSHTTVENYDTILVEVNSDKGVGWGESTFLENYSSIDIDSAWEKVSSLAEVLVGKKIDEATEKIKSETRYPFVRSGLLTGVETRKGEWMNEVSVPIVGILSVEDEEYRNKFDQLASKNYRAIKIKIGFNPETDAERVSEIVNNFPEDTEFRVDANQAYSLSQAKKFLRRIPEDRVDILEQPLATGQLDKHSQLRSKCDVELMLDEEVVNKSDVYKISRSEAADVVKMKLMKQGGYKETLSLIRFTKNKTDLGIVLGNGVQTGIGCLQEASLWSVGDIRYAGEFNGWLKSESSVIDGIRMNEGELRWSGGDIDIPESIVFDKNRRAEESI